MQDEKPNTIKEWVKLNKEYLIHAACMIAIAVIVAAIMIPDIGVTHGRLEATIDRFDLGISHIGSELADQAKIVQSMDVDLAAAEDKVDALGVTVSGYDDTIAAAVAKADAADAALEDLQGRITVLNAATLEAWLTGTSGNYTVHAKAGKAGDYATIIHLGYTAPAALNGADYAAAMADFYDNLDTAAANFRAYVPTVSYNGTAWHLNGILFSAGLVTLEAGTEKATPVLFGGLPVGYKPDWAYVEIWPVWRESS